MEDSSNDISIKSFWKRHLYIQIIEYTTNKCVPSVEMKDFVYDSL